MTDNSGVSRVTSWRSSAVAQKKRHPTATAHGMQAQARVDDVQSPLPSPSPSTSPSTSAPPVLPGAVRQIPPCAGKRSAVTSASTERVASDPLCARAGVTKPRAGVAAQSADDALCAPGAEPSQTSIMEFMELMAKVAEDVKAGKAPRPAARAQPAPITAPRPAARAHPAPITAPRSATRVHPAPITAPRPAARADPSPRKNHEKKSFMNVTGTSSATQHNDPKKLTKALKAGISVRVALNQRHCHCPPRLPPPPAYSPPPDSLAHQKGNMPRGYFMRLRKM